MLKLTKQEGAYAGIFFRIFIIRLRKTSYVIFIMEYAKRNVMRAVKFEPPFFVVGASGAATVN